MKLIILLSSLLLFSSCLSSSFYPEQRCLDAGNSVESMTIEHTDIKGKEAVSKTKIVCKRG